MSPPPDHPWFPRHPSLVRPKPKPRTIMRVTVAPTLLVQHIVRFVDGDPWAKIAVHKSHVSFPEPLDEEGYPTPECAEWLIQATDFICEDDGRARLLIWPDKSSTSFVPRHPVRHYPPPQQRHQSRHGWPPMKPN